MKNNRSEKHNRSECQMRHKDNGNCLPAGGICTAVSDPICEALNNAYYQGVYDATVRIMRNAWEREQENTET